MIIFNVVTKNLYKFCQKKFLGRGYNATLTNQKQLLWLKKKKKNVPFQHIIV